MTAVAGITGGSGAGKTALALALREALGPGQTVIVSEDDFYRDLSHLPIGERARRNFDEPDALDLPRLARCLLALRRGEAAGKPLYDMRTHCRCGAERVAPRPFVLLDGVLLAADPAVRAALDLLVYVDLPEAARFARRLARDVAERGRSPDSVRRQWEETVEPMFRLHVSPARDFADVVVPGDAPLAETAARLALTLRRRSHTDLTAGPPGSG